MEIVNTDASEAVEPCWPFWGLLIIYSERARRPNHIYPVVSFYSKEDDFFNRFDRVAEAALEMLSYRSLDDLRCSAGEIQAIINLEVASRMEKDTEMLVRTLCEHGGYQLKYLPEGSSRTEDDIRELLKNWSSEWDDDSGLTPRYSFSDMHGLSDYLEHHKYDDKEGIQLGLTNPNEHEFYAVVVLMIICNAVHLNRGAQRRPELIDHVIAIGEASIEAVEALALAETIEIVNALRSAVALEQIAPVAAAIEKLDRDRETKMKKMLSKAGAKGSEIRHALSNELKNWALKEGKNLKGHPADKARKLMNRLPSDIDEKIKKAGDKFKDPERVIREALVKQRNESSTASQPHVTDD